MNYANIKYYDIANGPGVRVSLAKHADAGRREKEKLLAGGGL